MIILLLAVPFLVLFALDEMLTYPRHEKMSREEEISWLMKQCNMTQEEAEYFADI